jgi:hypothetical protein
MCVPLSHDCALSCCSNRVHLLHVLISRLCFPPFCPLITISHAEMGQEMALGFCGLYGVFEGVLLQESVIWMGLHLLPRIRREVKSAFDSATYYDAMCTECETSCIALCRILSMF